jgi:uncharacterized protein YukE
MSEPGINIDGAGIDMYPTEAAEMMTAISGATTDASSGWQSASAKISALDGKLGQGPMGREIAKMYNPAVKQIREAIDTMQERLDQLSAAGNKAVPLYVDTDQRTGQYYSF